MEHAPLVLLLTVPHRPNAMRLPNGEVAFLSEEKYDDMASKTLQRGQVPGALYSSSLPGFRPSDWEHVVRAPHRAHAESGGTASAPREVYLNCATHGDGPPSLLYVAYPRSKDIKWSAGRKAAMDLYKTHNQTRGVDLMLGGMVGIGKHISRLGGAVVDYASSTASSTVHGLCGGAGQLFDTLFTGRNVGYEELPRLGGNKPPTWACSRNLGNPSHYDGKDGARGYAQWYMENPQAKASSWLFILPEHGIAVELQDGAVISWDGRAVMHCSSVPDAETDLYSLWCSVPHAAEKQHTKDTHVHEELRKRCAKGGVRRHPWKKGEKAWLLWLTKTHNEKVYDVTIEEVFRNGEIRVKEEVVQGTSALQDEEKVPRLTTLLDADMVGKFLVPIV